MNEETTKAIEVIMDGIVFKTGIVTTVGTLMTWLLVSVRNASKKIKEAPTRQDLDKIKDDAFKYTDNRMKIHEDLQIMEIANLKDKVVSTHKMVSELYAFHLKK